LLNPRFQFSETKSNACLCRRINLRKTNQRVQSLFSSLKHSCHTHDFFPVFYKSLLSSRTSTPYTIFYSYRPRARTDRCVICSLRHGIAVSLGAYTYGCSWLSRAAVVTVSATPPAWSPCSACSIFLPTRLSSRPPSSPPCPPAACSSHLAVSQSSQSHGRMNQSSRRLEHNNES
jgi:hypothetical protein